MTTIQIGALRVSRFILGSNPFSGFSHQGGEWDMAMRHYFTTARIKAVIREAEALGVNTLIARADHHVLRLLLEYWDEGGTIQWFAQTCPEVGSPEVSVERAAAYGAKACHIHGGVMDFLYAQGRLGEVPGIVAKIRDRGMLAGVAGHDPRTHEWARDHLDIDFHMCSHYNPIPREENAEHRSGTAERYEAADRDRMVRVIATIDRPVIHYKVLAAGRNDPAAAFRFTAAHMRAGDAVCVGVFPRDKGDMLAADVGFLAAALSAGGSVR
jgi:hypothetical protein